MMAWSTVCDDYFRVADHPRIEWQEPCQAQEQTTQGGLRSTVSLSKCKYFVEGECPISGSKIRGKNVCKVFCPSETTCIRDG
jgi:hypothetical protein